MTASMTFSNARILIIGGSGRTGKLIIDEALRRGHPITALVRNPTSIPVRDGLTIVEGSPLQRADIEKAVLATPESKPALIISALGQTRKSGNPWATATSPRRLMADAMSNTLETVKEHKMAKVVAVSMFGAGDSFPNLNFLMRWIMKGSVMEQTLEDQNLMDEKVKKSGVNYVLARPCMLKGDVARPIKFYGLSGDDAGFMPSISPLSVAMFLLDAAEQEKWDRTTPVITN